MTSSASVGCRDRHYSVVAANRDPACVRGRPVPYVAVCRTNRSGGHAQRLRESTTHNNASRSEHRGTQRVHNFDTVRYQETD